MALSSGSLRLLDARETLDEFVVDGPADRKRFRTHIGRLIAASRTARKRLRVYGEMVDSLCRDGRLEAAVRFEELWHEIARHCRLSRLCACGAPILDPRGRIRGAVLVFRDVTNERRAEEELRQSEERLRQIIASVYDYAISCLIATDES